MKINRRQFLTRAGAGALAAIFAPGMLAAAGRNVAPVAPVITKPGNPLFTGALGRYEGVTIVEYEAKKDFEFYQGDQWDKAQMSKAQMKELMTRGSTAVKVYSPSSWHKLKSEWIPFDKIIRQG